MGNVQFRAPAPGDIEAIEGRLRAVDRLECLAFGFAPRAALELSLGRAAWSRAITVDGDVEGLMGVGSLSLAGGLGTPWLLGTERLAREKRAFLRAGPRGLAHLQTMFPQLENYVHRDNVTSLRWLRWLGFVVDPEPVHIGGQPMLHFHKGFPLCASTQEPSL